MTNQLITQEIDLIQLKMAEWRAKMRALPVDCNTLVDETIQSFSHLLDEIVVAYKDLDRINTDLIQSQLLTDLEHQRYKELFENAPLGYLILDRAGKIRDANATASRVLHEPGEVLVGQSLVGMIADEDQRKLREFLRRHPAEGIRQEAELHLKRGHPAAEKALLRINWSPETGQQGSEIWVSILQGPLGLWLDRPGSVNEERFLAMTQVDSNWFWETDAKGIYTYASPKIRDILGYEPEDMIGRSLLNFRSPEEAERLAPILRAHIESLNPLMHLENYRIHKNGGVVYLETTSVPAFDRNGTLLGFRGADRDITERKVFEENLRDCKQKTMDILESISDAFMEIDRGWRFTSVSRQAAAIMGFPPQELIGKTLWQAFPHILGRDQETIFRQVMESGQSTHLEIEWPENRHWYDFRIYPTKEGMTTYWVDITARKHAEKELREREKRLR